MESAWIQIFVLSFFECVAPAGKAVCQEQHFELEFLTQRDCEYALQQLIAVKDELDNVIINRGKSKCTASAKETSVYRDPDTLRASSDSEWREPRSAEERRESVNAAHDERLAKLKTCEETNGAAPCKIGEIIVEEARGETVEVWRRN